jgi:hypothetical protein
VRLKEKAAVPVLIASLEGPITPRFGEAEEVLFRLAGEASPTLAEEDEASRRQYRRAWQEWWKENAGKADLAALEAQERPLGRTVVVLLDDNQVLDLDAGNKVRWKIDNVQMALDVQPLPGDRVLLAEYNANRVTERNSKGEVVWERKFLQPLAAQRLANGHTLIANRQAVVEIDRTGRQVFSYSPPAGAEIMRASKLPGGDVVLITQLGVTRFVRVNRFGREVKSFGVEVSTSGGRLGATPSGHVLVPELDNNRICEYDRSGRLVREIPAARPIAAVGLPNGHVIVTSMTEKRALELDRSGREVWEYRRDTRVTRAVRH